MEKGTQRGAVRLLGGVETSRSVVFKLAELKKMTNNFSPYHLLGEGAFGKVYKVTLTNGDMIAVKRFASTIKALQDGHFENEAQRLMGLKHPNIVQLVGYCSETESEFVQYYGKWVRAEKPERLLCLEYMPNGNLRRHLSDETSGLDWNTRYTIIKGICCGLLYLHEEWNVTPIIHMDLKPENILLDDKMVPRIADFGLSRLFGEEQTRIYTLNCKGTLGYMPREYIDKGVITKKFDIFSLGVIIIEIITSRKDFPTDETETASQKYIDLVLSNWRHRKAQGYTSQDIVYRQIKKCIQIGLLCVKFDPVKRPTIKQIIEMLEREVMSPPGPAVSFSNGHVYSSPMLHPSQQQGAQQQSHQKTQMPSLPSSSQKHQPQQSQGLLGYAPNTNNAGLGYAPNANNAGLGYAPNANAGIGYAPNANAAAATASNSQKPFPQSHFFISNTYAAQAQGTTRQQATNQQNALSAAAGNNMKVLHPSSSGGSMRLSVATHISSGGVPHKYMSATQLTFGPTPNPSKPSSDQKPAAGK